jgi:hypothetical protein
MYLKHLLLIGLCLSLVAGSFCNTASADPIPTGSYNAFTQAPGGKGPTETDTVVKITAKAKDGTTFDQEFTFGVGTLPDAARDTIRKSLAKNGWKVENATEGNGITIMGHDTSPITEVDSGAKNTDVNLRGLRVSTDASSGVKQGQATVGQDYKFAFLPLNPGSTVLDSNGRLIATLDGLVISTDVFAGQGPDAVAAALFAAFQKASVPAQLQGNEISFITDGQGNEVLHTDLTLTAGGLESLITIPERTVVPEPAGLLLLSSGILGLAGRAWCRRKRAVAGSG